MAAKQEKRSKKIMVSERELLKGLAKREPSWLAKDSKAAVDSETSRKNSVDLFSVAAHKSLSFSAQTEERRKIVAARLSGMGHRSAKAGGSGATRKNSVDLFSVTAHKSLSFSGQTNEESREVVAARLSGMGSRIASFREQSKHAKARENSLDLFSVTAHKSLSFSGQTKEESGEVVAARLSGMGSRIASFREQSKHAKARENSLDLFSVTAHKNLSFGSGGVSWPRSGGGERRKSAGR